MPEYYRILGISPKAGIAEVKRRFRLLALKFHPDHNPRNPKAADRFREVADAYSAICNRNLKQPIQVENRPEPQKPTSYGNNDFIRQKLDEFFGGDAISLGFNSFCGPDFRYDLQVPFLAALWGLEKHIEFSRLAPCRVCQATGMQPGSYYQDCPSCQGQGRRRFSSGQLRIGPLCDDCQGHGKIMAKPCSHCGGQGNHLQLNRYKIVIPPGVEDGSRILINGEGGEGFHHGPPGHLVVVVHVEPHVFFTRCKNDVYITLDISFAQAVLGATIKVPTPFGMKLLDVPRDTRSGQRFVLDGLGVPAHGNACPGNLIVTVKISQKARFDETDYPQDFLESRTESK